MHPFTQIASVFITEDKNIKTAVELLLSYFEHCINLKVFPATEKNVVLGLLLKGFPPHAQNGWWTEVSSILEQASERLVGNTEERAPRFNSRKSFYMTLSEPLTTETLDREPFERIFHEVAKILGEKNKANLVSNIGLN